MDFRQIVRWAIPGWLFIIFFLLFRFISHSYLKDELTWHIFGLPLGQDGLSPLELVLALLGAGLPVGYLVDQVYFFDYWSRWIPFFVSYDRGYEILKDCKINFKGVLGQKLDRTAAKRRIFPRQGFPGIGFGYMKGRPKNLMERYRMNLSLAEFAWYHTLLDNDIQFLERERQFLSDMYHSLGSVRSAIWYSWLLFMVLEIFVIHDLGLEPNKWILFINTYINGLVVNSILLVVLQFILSQGREDTLFRLIALMRNVIRSLSKLPRA